MNSRSGCLREFEETGFRPAGILDPLGEAIQAEARGVWDSRRSRYHSYRECILRSRMATEG